ncbi:hypothetical protein [Scopulibacillus darangshiensis]|uniref:hypothetical protein n=1 Tax=Scopulibacillus darangshiensis TaxID=442528 RepID=UPI001404B329|nr:hypothetical protein [Scopulibacillus darangshiensis]
MDKKLREKEHVQVEKSPIILKEHFDGSGSYIPSYSLPLIEMILKKPSRKPLGASHE